MAGSAKPNVPDLGKEAQYQHLGGVTHSSDGRGLFDGKTTNGWKGHEVAYWNDSEKYVDVLIDSTLVNIWRSGTDGWKQHSGKLKIQVKNQNGVLVDVTNNYPQNVNQIGNTQWEKTIENLPKGEYRFSYGTGYRLDSEWYIEKVKTDDVFLKVGESYIQKNESGEYSLTQEKTTIDLPIDITEQLKELLSSNNSKFDLVVCTEELDVTVSRVQTTHELNLLQNDLLQADKIQLLNWFESEEVVGLQVFGELNNKFTSVEKTVNHEQVLKIVADSMGNAKFLVSEDKNTWKRWNTVEWETVTFSYKDEIATLGMSKNALKDITKAQWEQLGHEFYLGVYLDKQTEIKNINYQSGIPNLTPEVSNASLYIINTKATLDITLQGNKLYGAVKDDDKGKVQYRIRLNGTPLEPEDGSWTMLEPEPQHINMRIPSNKILIGEQNTLEIEFQDAWGSSDTWIKSFIGELNGLLFFDEDMDLYSDDEGNVRKNLDFGIIIAGQLSMEHKVIFKNTTGTPINKVSFESAWEDGATPVAGVHFLFSLSDSPFVGHEVLELDRPLDHNEEIELYIKMQTTRGITPDSVGAIRFCARAEEISDTEYSQLIN